MTDDELKALFEGMRRENADQHAETRNQLAEVHHQLEIRIEAARVETQVVAEGVVQLADKLDRTAAALDEKIDRTAAETQAMIKFSHSDLDRRFRTLEETVAGLEERVERLERSTTH